MGTARNPCNPRIEGNFIEIARNWGLEGGRWKPPIDLLQWANETIDRNLLPPNTGMRGDPNAINNQLPIENVAGIIIHHDGGVNPRPGGQVGGVRTASGFRHGTATRQRPGYHFIIGQDGSINQLIPIDERSAHSGRSGNNPNTGSPWVTHIWGASANATTISISYLTPRTVNGEDITSTSVYTALPYAIQYEVMIKLVAYLIAHHNIPPRVSTHSRVTNSSTPDCPPIFSQRSFDRAGANFGVFTEFENADESLEAFLCEVSVLAGVQVTHR